MPVLKKIPTLENEDETYFTMSCKQLLIETNMAFKTRLIIYYVNWVYRSCKEKEGIFLAGPEVTMLYQVLIATFEKKVIDSASIINELIKRMNLRYSDIIGFEDLRKHRVYQSHSYKEAFSDKSIESFIKAGGQSKEDPTIHLWKCKSTIHQFNKKNKLKTPNRLEIPTDQEMVSIAINILESVLIDKLAPSREEVFITMQHISLLMTGLYCKEFQEMFILKYSEGPYIG